jgi:2-polyprenyl-3-methyl-5-hydroxy-6-metoxy-1,4-benzoquinol methylase
METKAAWYADRLKKKETIWWKRLMDRQAPYRWKLQSLDLGFVLDVGCGLGRNLDNLGGHGVGVDHNEECVAEARRRGFVAFTASEFEKSEFAVSKRFDSLLLSHVLEHLTGDEGRQIITEYLRYIRRPGGKVVLITPQEVGYRSDPTHKTYLGLSDLARIANEAGLQVVHTASFPFPPWVGRYLFPYNENVLVSQTM